MKWKTTLVLLLFTVGAGAYVSLYELRQPTAGERAQRSKRVIRVDPASVSRLALAVPNGRIALERSDGVWRLEPERVRADEARVTGVLDALNPMTAERVLTGSADHPLDYPAFGLSPAAGSITVTADGRTTTIQFGDTPPVGDGRYVKLADRPEVYVVRTTVLDDADQPRPLYRDPLMFRLESFAADFLRVTAPERAFSVERSGDGWRLTDPMLDQADRAEVTTLLNRIGGLRVERFLDEAPQVERLAEYGFDRPAAEIIVVTQGPPSADPAARRSSSTTTLFFGKPLADAAGLIYAKRSDEPALYAVAASDVQALLADPHGLRAKGCFDFFTSEVTKVSVRIGEQGWTAVKRDGQWVEEGAGAALDAKPIEALLSTAADLRLGGFVEDAPADLARYGLAPPRGTLAVWTEGDDQAQRLFVGDPVEKTSNRYGRIEGRPAVVRLPEVINELMTTPIQALLPKTEPPAAAAQPAPSQSPAPPPAPPAPATPAPAPTAPAPPPPVPAPPAAPQPPPAPAAPAPAPPQAAPMPVSAPPPPPVDPVSAEPEPETPPVLYELRTPVLDPDIPPPAPMTAPAISRDQELEEARRAYRMMESGLRNAAAATAAGTAQDGTDAR